MDMVIEMRKKAFLHLTEAVLAIVLLITLLNQVNTATALRYSDPAGKQRLSAIAHDLAFSQCNDQNNRYKLAQDLLTGVSEQKIGWALTDDVAYRLELYDQQHRFIASNGSALPTGQRTTVTASCMIAGSMELMNNTNYTYSPHKLVAIVWNK